MNEQLTTRFEFDQLVFVLSFLSFILSIGVFVLSFMVNYRRAAVFVVPLVFALTVVLFASLVVTRTLYHRRCRQNPKLKQSCSPLYLKRSIVCAWGAAAMWFVPMGLIWLRRWPSTIQTWEHEEVFLLVQLFLSLGNVLIIGIIAFMLDRGRRQFLARKEVVALG
uniref:Uncharacterized protein n=1 Tax=Moniliophthora roreri TaxID=221103 RepID=A0A0W0GA50_MONRR